MLCEAKYRIILIFDEVEKKLQSKKDENGMERLSELKSKVDEAMKAYDNLNKWSIFKNTNDYHSIVTQFSDTSWEEYPEMALANAYFQKPCFFNED